MGEDKKNIKNENDLPKKFGYSLKGWISSVSFILFLFNIWKFLNTPGAEIPILSILYNMVIYLGIIIFINLKNVVTNIY